MTNVRFSGADIRPAVNGVLAARLDPEKDYDLTIKEHKEKRSLQANNYSWALTDKLSEKMLVAGVRLSKEEMHAEMIYRYGQPEYNGDKAVIISVLDGVDVTQFYPYAKEIGQGEVNGNLFTHWRVYRGSHTYDKREMSLFIRGIVEECHELGITTETPEEIARMISLMKEADHG